ncbi:MAG: hypothetical protein UW52_C0058G0002 [Candidatus Gottesmanbacteria bacterium GW2011_GWA1_44_24b]|uniref:GxxExxY protein n=1 Tax=Candidatus Gottesmanbacteria bacterium GW2011_GWA1_44_24b TaxID=1618437 RepID=A0A0G1IIS3_9BACT|nr:MAG: hypothetical protein UW52_C0058G0002 [Candidatus Gottesmanbacteria bacterium GW2011_GWA1_44_24b]HCM82854.1 GxxExxY protein [Patescibacteria group bacterium]
MKPIKKPAVFEDLTYKIIGIAYTIHKELGPIHKEQVYQKALVNEFQENHIPFKKEIRFPVIFKGKNVGVYIPDFIIDDKVIIEIKAMNFLPLNTTTQLTYYLKSTGYKVGLLLNFGSPKLQVRRRIYG